MYSSARLVVLLSLVTQGAGFLKTLLIAYFFGAGPDLDGYYLALVPPSLLVGMLGGLLQTGFTPVYMGLIKSDVEAAAYLRNRIFTLLLLVLIPLGVVLSIYANEVVGWFVLKSTSQVTAATVSAFTLLAHIIALNTVADFLALTLNAHKRFFLAASAPLGNMLLSSVMLVLWPAGEQMGLTVGLLAGVTLQLVLVGWGLWRIGMPLQLVWPRPDKHMRRVVSLASAILAGVMLANLNLSVDQVMAAMAGEGAVSLIGYANRFHNLIVQVLIMGVGTVLLPHLTELYLEQRHKAISDLFVRLSGLLLFVGILVPIAIQLIGAPVIGLLLERGKFGTQDVAAVTGIWFWYSLGLAPMAWGIFIARYFQASSHPMLITKLALLTFLANIILNLLLIVPFGVYGLAMSTSLTYLLVALLYHAAFMRKTNFTFGGAGARQVLTVLLAFLFLFWSTRRTGVAGVMEPLQLVIGVLVLLTAVFLLRLKREFNHLREHHG